MKRLFFCIISLLSFATLSYAQTSEDFQKYLKQARKGDMISQYNVGVCYSNAAGTVKDSIQAFDWFLKSAEQGYRYAQFQVGNCYYNGVGVLEDIAMAASWYRKAADQGFDQAQIMMAICHYDGLGVDEDEYQTVGWLRKAAEQGNPDAQYMLGLAYFDGDGAKEDNAQANEWFLKAADQDYLYAFYMLGVMRYWGLGVEKDWELAESMFSEAAEKGHLDSRAYLSDFEDIYYDFLEEEEDLWLYDYLWYDDDFYDYYDEKWYFLDDSLYGAIIRYVVPEPQIYESKTLKEAARTQKTNKLKYAWWDFTDFMSEFNCPKGYGKPIGVSVGYVSKDWSYTYADGSTAKASVFDEKALHGLQAGFRWEPVLKYGFAFDTGLYYEYYNDKSDLLSDVDDMGAYNYYMIFQEHNIHFPVHVEYRLNFAKNFQMFAYAGASLDYALYGRFDFYEDGYDKPYYTVDEGVYTDDVLTDTKRFNASLSFGAGFRIYSWQINAGHRMGLINMSSSSEYIVKQNNPLNITVSYMF